MIASGLLFLAAIPGGVPLPAGRESAAESVVVASGAVPASRSAVFADTVIVLPEVRVTGERRASDARRQVPTGSVSELRTGVSGRAFETLADVLGGAAGIHVQQYGGLGAFSTVSLRGAPPGQVAVFLDGAPVTSAGRAVVSLSDLPVAGIEKIEVYRGLSPLAFGPASPGGAINLVSGAAVDHAELRIAGGSFGTWEGRGTTGGRRGDVAALLTAGYQGSRGDFTYHDDNGTEFNPDDDGTSTRVNNRFDAWSGMGSLTWQPNPGWRLSASGDAFHKAQGVPGIDAVPAYDTHLDFTRSAARLTAARTATGALPDIHLRGGLTREQTQFRDPGGELGLGQHETDDHLGSEDASVGLDWSRLPRSLSLELTGAFRHESADLADAADGYPDPPPSRRETAGGAAALQWRTPGERVLVHAAVRQDWMHDRLQWVDGAGLPQTTDVHRTLTGPQAGVRVAVAPGVALRANWADARRAPDFLELFGNQGSVLGSPDLRPERARNWDVAVSYTRPLSGTWAMTLDASHYASRAEDLIVYVRHSQSSVRAENVSSARIDGEEVSARLDVPGGFAVMGEVTFLRTQDTGPVSYWNGRWLPQRPNGLGRLRLDWRRADWRAVGDLQYVGENYRDRANLYYVADRALVGASLSFTPGGGRMCVTAEGKNLGNDRASDVGGFPLPGRAFFVSCDVRLGGAGPR